MSTDTDSTKIAEQANIEALRELLNGYNTEPISTRGLAFIKNYFADRNSLQKLKEWAMCTPVERLREKLPPEDEAELYTDVINDQLLTNERVNGMLNSRAYLDIYYRKAYAGLRELGKANKDYSDLLTEIHELDTPLNEIFVRLVEEQEGVTITSAKQLQDVTGIHRLKWDELSDKEAREEARSQMESTFMLAMEYRYEQALLGILDKGGNYGDLLELSPAKFNLPDYHRDSSIAEAIYQYFYLMDTSTARPNIKDIAEILGAPYETVYQASQRHTIKPLPWKQQD